jgi:hypothetical protein
MKMRSLSSFKMLSINNPSIQYDSPVGLNPHIDAVETSDLTVVWLTLPSINPTLIQALGCCGFVLHSILGHVGGGNRCGAYTLLGLPLHTLANGALVYPSLGRRYCAEGNDLMFRRRAPFLGTPVAIHTNV